MLEVQYVIVVFFIFAITAFDRVDARLDVFKKPNFTSLGAIYNRHYSFENGRLLYAVCKLSSQAYKCKVIQERSPFENATYSCNVTLELEEGTEVLSAVIVLAFGKDKALLSWEDTNTKTYDKFITIHLPECRQSKQYKLRDRVAELGSDSNNLEWVRLHQIITYNDTYDVFSRMCCHDENVCSEKQLGRMTIDAEGNKIQDLRPFTKKDPFEITSIHSAQQNSPAKGYVYMMFLNDWTVFMMMQPDGSEKQLMWFYRNDIDHSISTDNGIIGICARVDFGSDTQCGQFNLDGNLILATNLTNENIRLQPIRMYNLSEGGFLLLFVEYEQCTYYSCVTAPSGYSIMKVNPAGEKVGSIRLKGGEEANDHEATHIWQKENGDGYCVFVPSKDDLVVNCFTDNDFE